MPLIPLLRRVRRTNPFFIYLRRCISRYLSSPAYEKAEDEEQGLFEQTASRLSYGSRSRWQRRMSSLMTVAVIILSLLSATLILGYIVYKPPSFLIGFLQWKYPDVLFHLPLSQRVVALTLDDAPSSETTRILDLLHRYDAKATFFVIGSQIIEYPDVLERILAEGHEIGNHGWADEPAFALPLDTLEKQVKDVEALIPDTPNTGLSSVDTKLPPKYFRPGSGFFSKPMVSRLKKLGYMTVLGSIYSHDPQIHFPKQNARHILSMVEPGGIIIMHDRRSYSAEQLELVLEGLQAQNWKTLSLGGLLDTAAKEGRKRLSG